MHQNNCLCTRAHAVQLPTAAVHEHQVTAYSVLHSSSGGTWCASDPVHGPLRAINPHATHAAEPLHKSQAFPSCLPATLNF